MFGLVGISAASMWSPLTLAAFIAVGIIYLYVTGPGRVRFAGSSPVPAVKKVWFLGGLAFLYGAFGSPIDNIGHMMFSFHMISMSFAYMFAAPMLLAGTPEWLLRPIGRIPGIRGFKFLLNPIFTLLFFNMAFSIYHLPAVHDFVMLNYTVHTAYYVLLMIAALLMWFPIICPLPEFDKLEGFRKMGYIFANSVLLTPACALIIFSGSAMYATYTDPMMWATAMGYCVPQGATALLDMFSGPQALGWLDAHEDQRTGGVLMKIFQEIVYGSILVYVFKQWYKRENPKKAVGAGDDDSLDPTPAYLEKMLRAQSDPAK